MRAAATDPHLAAEYLFRYDGPWALSRVARKGRGDVMLFLLKMGLSATEQTHRSYSTERFTPLQLACRHNFPEVVQYLWTTGPHMDDVRKDLTAAADALVDAAAAGHVECIQLLIGGAGGPASPLTANSRLDAIGMTALHHVCTDDAGGTRRKRIVGMLLNAGSSPDAHDDGGRTPMHFAAISGSAACCSELIRAGASIHMRDRRTNRTPCEWAVAFRSSLRVQELLLGLAPRSDDGEDEDSSSEEDE